MANILDIDTAKTIVRQFYSSAADPALEDLLESSKSVDKGYRPYFVAAYFIHADYRRIVKADEVTFDYDAAYTVQGLLTMQKSKDCNDVSFDSCWSVDTILETVQNDIFSAPSAFVL